MADEDDEGGGLEEEKVCPEGAPDWVVTFGDMMSLLLTFFILLLSFSTMDSIRFKEMAGTIKKGFGVAAKEQQVEIQKATHFIREQTKIDYNARKVLEQLKRRLDPLSPKRKTARVDVEVYQSYRGVVVLFPADDVFRPRTAQLRDEVKPLLDVVALQAQEHLDDGFELAVEVRAPEGEPRAPQFEDVWSLTAARAISASDYIRESGGLDPSRVMPVGRGPAPSNPRAGQPDPPPSGSTVEFLFLSRKMTPHN